MINSIEPYKLSDELAYWIDKKGALDISASREEIAAFYGSQGMLSSHKAEYKTLRRKCTEKHRRLYDRGNGGGRIKSRSPNAFNNQLDKMQEFLRSIPYGDFSENSWFRVTHEK